MVSGHRKASRAVEKRQRLGALAEALRQTLRRERAEREKLQRDLEALRAEVNTIRALADIEARLARIEGTAPPRGALRAV